MSGYFYGRNGRLLKTLDGTGIIALTWQSMKSF